MNSNPDLKILCGISEIADNYDGFIFDLWGVVHNGIRSFPGAVDVMGRLRGAGKKVGILSNAPRRISTVMGQLETMGIMRDRYDAIMSSGEEVWLNLRQKLDPWYRELGRKCLHIGNERDRDLLIGLDLHLTKDLASADFLLNTGPYTNDDDISSYEELFRTALARNLPMICANPDLIVMRGDRKEICAGLLARRYEDWGGAVRWHGKPNSSVYTSCLERLNGIDVTKVLMIGDSLQTDICGANRIGMDSLFVVGGIHAFEMRVSGEELDLAKIADAVEEEAFPNFVIATLIW